MRETVKRFLRFFSAPVWQNYVIAPTFDLGNMTTEALDEYIRNTTLPSSHLVGSAAMTARDAGYGVVDPDLLVKGVARLRVIDASVLVSSLSSRSAQDTNPRNGSPFYPALTFRPRYMRLRKEEQIW